MSRLLWISGLTIVTAFVGSGVTDESLGSLRRAVRSSEYIEPTAAELSAAEAIFRELLREDADAASAARACQGVGLELLLVRERGVDLRLVRERPPARRGWGAYAFRIGKADPLVIEAPHGDSDLHTAVLAELLFLEGRARAAAWNTAHRSTREAGSGIEADLAHLPDSLLHAFHRAFVAACPDGIALQLHGFDAARRRDGGPELIISNGTRCPPDWFAAIRERLSTDLEVRVSLFPTGTDDLGGTTNTHVPLFRSARHGGFVHVEMGLDLRARLKAEAAPRERFRLAFPGKQP